MKKFTLLMMATLLAITGWSQETVSVGTGTYNSYAEGAVLGGYYGYERHAELYTHAELVNANFTDIASAEITKIAFQLDALTAPTANRKIKIYIKNVSDATLTTALFSNWTTLTANATLVYDQQGAGITLTASSWNEFVFSTPFQYTGENILIFTDTEGNSTSGGAITNIYYHTSTGKHWQARADAAPLSNTASGSTDSYRANIVFTLDNVVATTCPQPTDLVATSTPFTASVAFTNNSAATEFAVEYKTATVSEWTALSPNPTASPATITGLTPETAYQVRVKALCAADDESTWTAGSFTTGIACPQPTALTAVATGTTTATIGWTAGASETAWDLVISTTTLTDPSTGTIIPVTANPYNASSLNAGTAYYVYVRANCGGANGVSTWSSANFATECQTIQITDATPYSENFDSYTGSTYSTVGPKPVCWYTFAQSGNATYTPHITGSGSYSYPSSTPNALTFTAGSDSYGGANTYAVLPYFNLPVNQLALSFRYRMESATSGNLTVGYITGNQDNLASYTVVATITSSTASTPATANLYFPSVPADATYLVFRWTHTSSYYSCGIDDVVVSKVPTCIPPSAVTIVSGSITPFAADVSWVTGGSGEAAWAVEYKTATATEWTLLSPNPTASPATIAGLTPETAYQVRVKALCAADDESNWSSTASFTTGIACPKPTAVTAVATGKTTATIGWTAGASETAWDLVISTTTLTDPSTGTIIPVAANTYNASDLNAGTTYYVYVRANCGGADGASSWTNAVIFTTVFELPYSQDFSGASYPLSWSRLIGAIGSTTTTTSSWVYYTSNALSGGHIKMNIYSTYKYWAVTPAIDLPAVGSKQLSFDVAVTDYASADAPTTDDTGDADDKFVVYISTDGGLTWDPANALRTWDNAVAESKLFSIPNDAGEHVVIDLSAYSGIVKIGFYGGSTTSGADYDLHIDNVNIFSNLPVVETLEASGVTNTEATLNSVVTPGYAAVTAQGYAYKAVADGEWIESLDGLLSGLTGHTVYEFKAFAAVALDTVWGAVLTFQTAHTPPTVVTEDATAITENSATLNKTVTAGTEAIDAEGFKYKAVVATEWIESLDGALTGLEAETEYVFKAYATTASGTVYGDEKTFTTLPIVGIANLLADTKVYPTLSNGTVNVVAPVGTVITVAEMNGKVLNSYKVNAGVETIDLNYTSGTYFVILQNGKANAVHKVILNK